jgi:hypothetical protein
MPGLGVEPDFDGDAILTHFGEQGIDLIEGLHREGAGRFQKNLEDAWSMAPGERVRVPSGLCHLWSLLVSSSQSAGPCGGGAN